ncbi:MAG TPA: DUF3696 domain-containing protein [Ignavibacteria bacterium]|nr:DUF3696 domain-containing protein [Ignavibacteria bacterium]HMQ98067.1 DUF3696 domain-containing protein [Ignavibacteria bacterium]
MLRELSINGFKSFLHRTLNLNQLTVLTGLNSSGKSTVLQSLLMLEKAYDNENTVLLDGYGSIEEIKNNYYNKNITFNIVDDKDNFFNLVIPETRDDLINHKTYSNEFAFPEIIYISANRFGPKTSVPIYNDNYKKRKIGPKGENLFQFIDFYEESTLHQSLVHPKSEGDTLGYNIRGWLSVISPNVKFNYFLDNKSDSSYSLFNDHRAMNVGFGLSYSLSVIAALLIGTLIRNSLIIIENPEAHLHPKGQTELAKLISLCAESGTQVIIETHSDHIFDGIRIATKEIKDFNKKVQIHWFEMNENLNTEVVSPNILEDGRLDEWPKGMFDQFEMNARKLI